MPFVEEFIVIRRRTRITEAGTATQILISSTTSDSDFVLATLERAKWAVGNRDFQHEPSLCVPGFPDSDDDPDE